MSEHPAKLSGLSERLIRSHWKNNYGGSGKALGVVKKHLTEALANKDTPPYIYNALKREHLLRIGSAVFHEYYFDNLGGSGQAGGSERKVIADTFGNTLRQVQFGGSTREANRGASDLSSQDILA